jgi:uncharacterized membrane protein
MSVESSDLGTISVESARAQELAKSLSHVRSRVRLHAIDVVRGLVMVLMALDHVRDYFTGVRFDPLDLTQTDPALFLTRWITHYCAPTFIFLAGVSAWLVSRRCTRPELTRFLFTRGLWLVVLEFTVVTLAWTFNFRYDLGLILQVIWAIGVSMIVLAALVRLPLQWIALFAVAMIAGHNLLDGIAPASFGAMAPLWAVLHVQQPIAIGYVHYPLIPWVGVMALGYVLGGLFELEPSRRRALLLALGSAMIVAFIALRLINGYGDPHPWSPQATAPLTVLSFLKVHKYPPSLLYVLMTLGPALLRSHCPSPGAARSPACSRYLGACHCSSMCCISCSCTRWRVWLHSGPDTARACSPDSSSTFRRRGVTACRWFMACGLSCSCCSIRSAAGSRRSSAAATTGGCRISRAALGDGQAVEYAACSLASLEHSRHHEIRAADHVAARKNLGVCGLEWSRVIGRNAHASVGV